MLRQIKLVLAASHIMQAARQLGYINHSVIRKT
jgi:hypothetical protein